MPPGLAGQGQGEAVGYVHLLADQVDPADLLADRMFHLQAGVHFQKVDVAGGGDHEFAGSQTFVADRVEKPAGVGLQAGDDLVVEEGGGGLFDQLLVAPLDRAVAGGIDGEGAQLVASALGFHMPGVGDEFLDEIFAQIPALQGIVGPVEGPQLVFRPANGDSPASASVGPFHHDRVAMFRGEVQKGMQVLHRIADAGDGGHLGHPGHPAGADLIAQIFQDPRLGADPGDPGLHDLGGEFVRFRQEAVAGMDGVRPAAAGDVQDGLLVEVGLVVGGPGEVIGLVRPVHVGGAPVRLRVDGDGGNAHLCGGADDAQGDLRPVGDQDFLHRLSFPCSPVRPGSLSDLVL